MPVEFDIQALQEQILSVIPKDQLKLWAEDNKLVGYQKDPVAFGEQQLKETYTDEIKQMMESVRDYQITIAQSANAVGKSHCAASIALWFYKCFPDSQVFTAAAPPEDNLGILWGEMAKKINRCQELFNTDKVASLNIRRNDWSFIKGVTIPIQGSSEERVSKFSGKHGPYLLFILDEGDAIPDEVYQGIETCLSGGLVFRLLVMFNPKRRGGKAYRMIKDGQANVVHLSAFTHPNVTTGVNLIPGAVTREKTIERINLMTIPLGPDEHPESDCFEVPEFLVGQTCLDNMNRPYPELTAGYRRVTNPEFFYLVLGQYPTQGEHQLIPQDWIEAARVRWNQYVTNWGENFPENTRPICGLDVADEGPDQNVFIARVGDFVKRPKKWRGVDPLVTASRAADYSRDENAACVNVDSGGVGASVAPSLRLERIRANKVMFGSKPTEKVKDRDRKAHFKCMRDQLWWEARCWLKPSESNLTGAMLPPDPELIEQLGIPTYEEKNDEIRVMDVDRMKKVLGGKSPDESSALILTFAPAEGRPRVRLITRPSSTDSILSESQTIETESSAIEERWKEEE